MTQDTRPYRHLNDDGAWPGFGWAGLELGEDGALRLMGVPRLDGVLPPQLAGLASAPPLGGVAIDAEGSIYFSDPKHALIRRIEGCFGQVEAAPCIGGKGSGETQMCEPAGLAVASHRHALYVADAGHHRVQIFDTGTLALIEILVGFQRPVSLALDEDGELYVVDTQAKRVDRYDIAGDRVPAFWKMVHASGRVTEPLAVACERRGEESFVYVLDGILIGAGDGTFLAWAGLAVLAAYTPAALWAATLPDGLVAVWVAMTLVFMGARGAILGVRARGDRWVVTGVAAVR